MATFFANLYMYKCKHFRKISGNLEYICRYRVNPTELLILEGFLDLSLTIQLFNLSVDFSFV